VKRSLFTKYVILFVGLVGGVLIINAALDLYFVYQDNRRASIDVQREKADAAAQRIESFVREIERQIGWVAHAQWSLLPEEQRRFDYVRLQRQVPAITELAFIDRQGKEQLKVSRLAMDVIGSGIDRSAEPAFTGAVANKVYFGPIYFHKESEPFFTMAVAHGARGGVTVAEVNLKLILDVIQGIRVGKNGYAYVVGGQGRLVAHPDMSLVLRGTDMASLPQVIAAHNGDASAVTDAKNLGGVPVLSAHAQIPALNWFVFVELPTVEAQQPVYDAGLRALVLLALGLLIAALAAALLARRMVVPIRTLQTGAERIGGGELGHRLSIKTGDELESLANQFNRSAEALQESYATLEQRVMDRTHELSESLEQQTATAEILQVISQSPTNVQPVLDVVVKAAIRFCGAPDAVIALRDGAEVVVAAHEGPVSIETRRLGTRLPLNRSSTMGRAIVDGETIHFPDLAALDPVEYGMARELGRDLGFSSTLAAPMVREGTAIGSILLRKPDPGAFTARQIELLETFAAQAVIAIQNVRLFTEIQEKSRQLEVASQHKSQFLANMSHELRTPLNAILGYTEMMSDGLYGNLPEKATGVLERVQTNGRHLLGLINDVLDLSKIEAGQFTLAIEEYSAADMVSTVVAATESLARTKGLALTTKIAPGLPTGKGDARRLAQVLLNLVGNALKFTDKGGVEIGAARTDGRFEFSVSDTGPGIAEPDQKRIFDEFQQVDNSSTRKKGGTGLGLSISRKIVELHGGRIVVQSELGKGSTFTVVIPVDAAPAAVVPLKEAAQ
jgi:signal transduction histidine kinase